MKLLVLLSCIWSIATAVPVLPAASQSSSNEILPMPSIVQASLLQSLLNKAPVVIAIPIPFDPAQGLPSFLNQPGTVLYPAFPGSLPFPGITIPVVPPAAGGAART